MELNEQFEIIRLEPENYYKCNNIWDMEKHPDRTKEWYSQMLEGSRDIFIYAVDDEYIGEIALFKRKDDIECYIPEKRIYISRLIVKSEFRNQGIGGLLIDFICRFAKDIGYSEAVISVDVNNLAALHLYRKKGFISEIYHGFDELGKYYKLLKIL